MLAGVVSSTPAFAHASLLSSYPPDSILMPATPGSIGLTFNEPVSIVSLQITDANGTRHPLVDGRLEGNSVVAGTPKGLPSGTNALSWRVVSADGHPVGGAIIFSVGRVSATGAGATQQPPARGGIWHLTVNALITDFSQATTEGSLVIRQ